MTTTGTSDFDRRLNDWFDLVEPRDLPPTLLSIVYDRAGRTGQQRRPWHRFAAAIEQWWTPMPRLASGLVLVSLTVLLLVALVFAAFAAGMLPVRKPMVVDGLIAVENEVLPPGQTDGPGRYQIRFIDPVTGEDVFTTPPDAHACAAHFSPDGSRYAFVYQDPAQVGTGVVSVGVANTSSDFHSTLLMQKDPQGWFHPSWAPDGSALAVIDEPLNSDGTSAPMQLWVVPADGSAPRQITDVPTSFSADWSSSGEWIAFVGQGNEDPSLSHALYVIRPDGSDLRKLADSGVGLISWSPTTDQLAFISTVDDHLHVVTPEGNEITAINSGSGEAPIWSPDGTRMALARGGQVKVFDVGTGAATNVRAPAAASPAAWSADGQQLLVSVNSPATDVTSIWMAYLDDTAPRFIADHIWTHCMSAGQALDWQRVAK